MNIHLPKVDKIANHNDFKNCFKHIILKIAKNIIEKERKKAINNKNYMNEEEILKCIKKEYDLYDNLEPKSLINATGVVVHTNLGRSVIHPEILQRAKDMICSYSNLEYNLKEGKRGQRYNYISMLLGELFDTESAIVVNNNASAVFLILNTFAKNQEVIVSRGELVEIGGNFRVPEVMNNSGAILKEVGTTNKTKINDYENAINENTNMILKVHQSNFHMDGFVHSASIQEISDLAKQKGLIDYYDLGSAYVNELPYGLSKREPPLYKVLETGVSLVSFSGDKLFGSVQCGIIVGKKELIEKIKKNQLLRMLRVDKITLSLLAESVKAYINKEYHLIPTQNQIYKSIDELKKTALYLQSNIKTKTSIIQTQTIVGGGAIPCKYYPTIALAFDSQLKAQELENKFRKAKIIGRIENDKFLFDLRSIMQSNLEQLIKITNEVVSE